MSSAAVEQTLLREMGPPLSSEESSRSESKRLCVHDDRDNNLNSIRNNRPQNSTRWSYTRDTNSVESEILEEMGVGMLDDVTNVESTKPQSQEYIILSSNSGDDKILSYETHDVEYDEVYMSSDITSIERQKTYNVDDLAVFNNAEKKPDYSSKATENLVKKNASTFVNVTDVDKFYLCRRKRKLSVLGENKFNKLSDEIILMILKLLPKKYLVRCMLVCKRWCQIARDEMLWTRLDVSNKLLKAGTLGYILPRGVQILRLAQAEIADPLFNERSVVLTDSYISKLQYLDLSMAVISPGSLAMLLVKCKYLKKLSLEKCILNKACCRAISQNEELEVLNLTMCEDLDLECITELMKLKRLTTLNIAWCNLESESLSLLCKTLPSSITRLNLAGYRKTLTDKHVRDLLKWCPDIIELDLSDCAILTVNSVVYLLNFSKLEHLSLSRCYSIPQSAYIKLAHMPNLIYFNVFGLQSESVMKALRECREINKFPYSSIARPTVGIRRTSIWGLRVRD